MSDENITEVGQSRQTFDVEIRLLNLRRWVDVELAKRGENHRTAAERAEVTPTYWSRIVNGDQISPGDLAKIAKGMEVTEETLKEQCAAA